jgi:signal transduction histidine kinase
MVGDRRWVDPVSALVVLLLAVSTVIAALLVREEIDDRLENSARVAATAVRQDVQLNLRRDVAAAAGLARSLPDVTAVDAATWTAAVEQIAAAGAFTDVSAVNLLVVAEDGQVDEMLASLPTAVTDQLDVRLADGPLHGVVTNVWPEEANAVVLGYDVVDNVAASRAAIAAITRATVQVSSPTRVLQEPADQRSAIVYVPVVPEPRGPVTGAINLVFRAERLLDEVLDVIPPGAHVRWVDAGAGLDPQDAVLADVGPPVAEGATAIEVFADLGRVWRIEVSVPRSAQGPVQRQAPWLVAALGAVLVLGLLASVIAWRSTARRADALARRRTADLEASARELATLNRELEELDRFKDRLLGAVSHDLRAPLAVIRGSAEVLLTRDLPPDQREDLLQRLLRQSARMRGLIDELLVAAQVRAGRLHAETRPVELRAVVDATVSDLGIGQVLPASAGSRLPRVSVDPVHLERVLHNLLTNAATHGAPPVEVELDHDGDAVEVRVRDRGPGVPEALRPRMFDEHTREGGTQPGYGLGLAIAAQLAEANGGTLTYEDGEPGACFVLHLPVHHERDAGGTR